MLTPSELLTHYRAATEATHRFWAYFQTISLATAAFAWSKDADGIGLYLLLSGAYLVFGALNHRLVVASQEAAVTTAASLKAFASSLASAPPNTVHLSYLMPVIDGIRPDPVSRVRLWHATLILATVGAIWLRPLATGWGGI